MLVLELFSSTCPAPHDSLQLGGEEEEEGRETKTMDGSGSRSEGLENEVHAAAITTVDKTTTKDGNELFVIGDGGDEEDADFNAPGTPIESAAAPPTTMTTPLTPGLLSARMQAEWNRGENGGEDTVFGRKNPGGGGYYATSSPSSSRMSPMCAMNTPRTRVYNTDKVNNVEMPEGEYRTISEDIDADLADIEQSSSLLNDDGGDDDGQLSHHFKESLLLPDQGDDNDFEGDDDGGGEVMDTILVDSNEDEPARTTTPDTSPGAKLTQSASRTKSSSEDEGAGGVKMHRHVGDDFDDVGAIPPQTPSRSAPPDSDEEENTLLLDEIRKDVVRTHPDLRFFLEPEEGLGQKRYAALERILFVWAKLNKGVREMEFSLHGYNNTDR